MPQILTFLTPKTPLQLPTNKIRHLSTLFFTKKFYCNNLNIFITYIYCLKKTFNTIFYLYFFYKKMTVLLNFSKKIKINPIFLNSSKSISNRVLIINELCNKKIDIQNLSNATDTQLLQTALQQCSDPQIEQIDIGAAGTTMRFLTAYCSTLPHFNKILTGSKRMQQRPIEVLVQALTNLGASIQYTAQQGYPPIHITGKKLKGTANHKPLIINGSISSQYLSALLLIAPTLQEGLRLQWQGNLVSKPYINMTLKIMNYFGVKSQMLENEIFIPHQSYIPAPFVVEADWSAASYYYAICAFIPNSEIHIKGLYNNSLQGDSVIAEWLQILGITTTYTQQGVIITNTNAQAIDPTPFLSQNLYFDCLNCPDIAQTLAVIFGGLGIPARLGGLQTLAIKETDRIKALQNELAKIRVNFLETDTQNEFLIQPTFEGILEINEPITFSTYDDHRMAMAFAPLAIFSTNGLYIQDYEVVSKSYPNFWNDLNGIGATTNYIVK